MPFASPRHIEFFLLLPLVFPSFLPFSISRTLPLSLLTLLTLHQTLNPPPPPSHQAPLLRSHIPSPRPAPALPTLLSLATLSCSPSHLHFNLLRAASVAVARCHGASTASIAAASAATAMLLSSSDVDVFAAAVMPAVVHGLISRAPGVFSMEEALVVGTLSVDFVVVPAIFAAAHAVRNKAPVGEVEAVMTLCALVAAVFVAGFVVPVAVHAPRKASGRAIALAFAGAVLSAYVFSWVVLVREPCMAALEYVFLSGGTARAELLAFWLVVLALAVDRGVVSPRRRLRTRRIVARKVYHLLAIVLFVPGVYVDPEFTAFAMAFALVCMLCVEIVRVGELGEVGRIISRAMQPVVDERDAGAVVITHMYLLVGNAAPLWSAIALGENPRGILALSGVICLGVQDAVASAIGSKYGHREWYGVKKTVEGTMAGVLAAAALAICWGYAVQLEEVASLFGALRIVAATACAGLFETFTSQIDNLVLPLYYFAALHAFGVK